MNLFEVIPGYAEAVAHEKRVRASSFLGATVDVGGIETRVMTVRDWIALDFVACPFVCGGQPDIGDTGLLLWRLSPNYRLGSWYRQWRHIRKVRSVIRSSGPHYMIAAAKDYVVDVFQDSPGGSGTQLSVPPVHWAVYVIAALCREYGWDYDRVLDMPVPMALQFLRHVELTHNPHATLFNPSDRVRGEWLCKQNQANQ